MRPAAICSAAAARAWAMAEADRSMARMWPVTSRAATARAAAPGPQPISRTRECGSSGSASTIAATRDDRRGAIGALEAQLQILALGANLLEWHVEALGEFGVAQLVGETLELGVRPQD